MERKAEAGMAVLPRFQGGRRRNSGEVMVSEILLRNDVVEVAVEPAYGARVTRLIDRRSGRDWMAPGGRSAQTGEDASYGEAEAVGWDECFPTVSPCDARGTVWGRALRDHGDLWGRGFAVVEEGAAHAVLERATPEFRFRRGLRLEGAGVVAEYRVENLTPLPMPCLWALHGLLSVRSGERIVLPGIERVNITALLKDGHALAPQQSAWPGGANAAGLPLDRVQPAASTLAAKLFAAVPQEARALVGGAEGWLELAWNGRETGHLGIWMTYGGWPAPGGVHQLALEPTSASAEDLAEAVALDQAPPLAPREAREWQIRLTLHAPQRP